MRDDEDIHQKEDEDRKMHLAEPLWKHQEEAVNGIQKEFSSAARTTLVMACGTGKTRVGAEVSKTVAPNGPVLISEPTVDLVAQTLKAWVAALGRQAMGKVVAVCGDQDLMNQEDTERLTDLGVEVTTNPERLAELLRAPDGRFIAATTYHSLPRIIEAHRVPGTKPWKLHVVDEAHRSAGIQGRPWSVLHKDELIPADKRLYMTATPRIVTGSDGSDVFSMDDEKVFGRVGYKLTFGQAREKKILADYRVVVSVVTDAEIYRLATSSEGSAFFQVGPVGVSADILARQVAVLRAARDLGVQRMLTYHSRIRDAAWFSQTLPAADALIGSSSDLSTGYVYGVQERAERRRVLDTLQSDGHGRVIISNAKVLSEGYDAPSVDAVAFLNPRNSVIDIVQIIGRALRLGNRIDKTAYIIIPIVLKPDQDASQALGSSQFSMVHQVVRALAAHDEDLAGEMRSGRRLIGMRNYRADEVPDVRLSTPQWLRFVGSEIPPGFADSITVQAVRAATTLWDEYLGAVTAYKEEHGRLPGRTHRAPGPESAPIGEWLSNQRRRRESLLPQQREALDALGIAWLPRDEQWQRGIEAARSFVERERHLRVPVGHIEKDGTGEPAGFKLGRWIVNNRQAYKRGNLSQERIADLEGLGIEWDVPRANWTLAFTAVRAFLGSNGHLNIPAAQGVKLPDGTEIKLASWLRDERRRLETGRLAPELAAELAILDDAFEQKTDRYWESGFRVAQKYHRTQGHLNPPPHNKVQDPDGHPFPLWDWLRKMRQEKAAGRLPKDRRAALEALGVSWDIPEGKRDQSWNAKFALAEAYYRANGTLDVPYLYSTDPPESVKLGAWIATQRRAFKSGSLSVERIRKLESVGMRWSMHGD
ncbi:Helicase associated domain protein [Actinacidiphila sp. DG2A-62]|uniref:DEAD/DEAH box helicase n=1 Tax=Actinacidiphila sp. DG2A-62 TaxID=3108821 RepID=UPI002DB66AB4|nr:Helicase associated domain protein [Actinacidiphila sp. DG2A-62]MEC3997200.1 Helicase associated domain protein [Actinacidiphila sp. DG2A-62]